MGSDNFAYLAGIIDSSKWVEVTPGKFSVYHENWKVLEAFVEMAGGEITSGGYGFTWLCPDDSRDDLLDCIKDYLRIYKVK